MPLNILPKNYSILSSAEMVLSLFMSFPGIFSSVACVENQCFASINTKTITERQAMNIYIFIYIYIYNVVFMRTTPFSFIQSANNLVNMYMYVHVL